MKEVAGVSLSSRPDVVVTSDERSMLLLGMVLRYELLPMLQGCNSPGGRAYYG